jgi:hypothetical protein
VACCAIRALFVASVANLKPRRSLALDDDLAVLRPFLLPLPEGCCRAGFLSALYVCNCARVKLRPFGVLVLVTSAFAVVAATTCKAQPVACPGGAPTVESVREVLEAPQYLDKTQVKAFNVTADSVAITIDAGDWLSLSGFWGAAGVSSKMHTVMPPLRRVAVCFPSIQTINAKIVSPAAVRRDQYGHELPPEGGALVVLLKVDCSDLRKFASLDLNQYSVYVANRYVVLVNPQIQQVWSEELQRETALGGFQSE